MQCFIEFLIFSQTFEVLFKKIKDWRKKLNMPERERESEIQVGETVHS